MKHKKGKEISMANVITKDGKNFLILRDFCVQNGLKPHNSSIYNKWTHSKKREREIGRENLSYKQKLILDCVINPSDERSIFVREDYLELIDETPYKKELEEIYYKIVDEFGVGDFQIANRVYKSYPLDKKATLANSNNYRHAMAVVNYLKEFTFRNEKKNEALYHALTDLYNALKSGKKVEDLIEHKPRITKIEKAKEIIKYFFCEIYDSASEVCDAVSDSDIQKLQGYREIIQAMDMRYIKAEVISAIDDALIEAMSEADDDDFIDYNDRFK